MPVMVINQIIAYQEINNIKYNTIQENKTNI